MKRNIIVISICLVLVTSDLWVFSTYPVEITIGTFVDLINEKNDIENSYIPRINELTNSMLISMEYEEVQLSQDIVLKANHNLFSSRVKLPANCVYLPQVFPNEFKLIDELQNNEYFPLLLINKSYLNDSVDYDQEKIFFIEEIPELSKTEVPVYFRLENDLTLSNVFFGSRKSNHDGFYHFAMKNLVR